MIQRAIFYCVAGVVLFVFVILFVTQEHSDPLKSQEQPIYKKVERFFQNDIPTSRRHVIRRIKMQPPTTDKVVDAESNNKIHQIADQQRQRIRRSMREYKYPNGKYGINAKRLEDLVIEEKGQPIRSMIVTTWRNGSTFLGDVINAHPDTFFHQEPLQDFDIVQIRGPPLAEQALSNLRALLNCEYNDLDHYVEGVRQAPWAISYNKEYWALCRSHKDLCYKKEFLEAMCKLYPFQLTKLVRLTLGVAQELLADKKTPLRMVYLVRDPRGTLQSRKHREWCPGVRDCFDPGLLCADLAADYKVAVELQKKYPNSFKVIRYEDLAAKPYERAEELANFFGLDFHPKIKSFLDSHTKRNSGGVSSTFRDSKQAPYHWKTELKFQEVSEIQKSCVNAMEYWGYVPAMNATHQRVFNPCVCSSVTCSTMQRRAWCTYWYRGVKILWLKTGQQ